MKGSANALCHRRLLSPAAFLCAALATLIALVSSSAMAVDNSNRARKPHYRPYDPGLRCQTGPQACWLASAQQVGRQCTCDKPGTKRGYGRVIR